MDSLTDSYYVDSEGRKGLGRGLTTLDDPTSTVGITYSFSQSLILALQDQARAAN